MPMLVCRAALMEGASIKTEGIPGFFGGNYKDVDYLPYVPTKLYIHVLSFYMYCGLHLHYQNITGSKHLGIY